MNALQFEAVANLARLRGRTREGLRYVYVDGMTAYAAAPRVRVSRQALYQARPRFERASKLLRDAMDAESPQRFK